MAAELPQASSLWVLNEASDTTRWTFSSGGHRRSLDRLLRSRTVSDLVWPSCMALEKEAGLAEQSVIRRAPALAHWSRESQPGSSSPPGSPSHMTPERLACSPRLKGFVFRQVLRDTQLLEAEVHSFGRDTHETGDDSDILSSYGDCRSLKVVPHLLDC